MQVINIRNRENRGNRGNRATIFTAIETIVRLRELEIDKTHHRIIVIEANKSREIEEGEILKVGICTYICVELAHEAGEVSVLEAARKQSGGEFV